MYSSLLHVYYVSVSVVIFLTFSKLFVVVFVMSPVIILPAVPMFIMFLICFDCHSPVV